MLAYLIFNAGAFSHNKFTHDSFDDESEWLYLINPSGNVNLGTQGNNVQ